MSLNYAVFLLYVKYTILVLLSQLITYHCSYVNIHVHTSVYYYYYRLVMMVLFWIQMAVHLWENLDLILN